jgi:uncharacterized protein YceH (UPF0502 family)
MIELDPVEARVIGSLAEKQLTTPQQYPLTLNALVLACNQSSNRDPIASYDDRLVEVALSSLKEAGLLRFVHPSHGRSVTRYRQVLDERSGLDVRDLALLAVLLLRGPQTVGELRTRTERMADFESLGDIEAELSRLSNRPDPLVRRLHRQPGQKEERWAQLFTGEPTEAAHIPGVATEAPPTPAYNSDHDDVASLRADMDALREELVALKTAVDEMRKTSGA